MRGDGHRRARFDDLEGGAIRRAGLVHGTHDAECEQHAAATVVAHDVDRRDRELAGTAESALGGDGSISDAFGGVAGVLDDAAQLDPTARPLAERGNALSAETAELTRDIRAYRESLQSDPERLQVLRERIQALRGLQRKYGANDAEVVAFCEETARRLASLGGADHRAEELAAEDETLRSRLSEQAGTIGTERSRAATR